MTIAGDQDLTSGASPSLRQARIRSGILRMIRGRTPINGNELQDFTRHLILDEWSSADQDFTTEEFWVAMNTLLTKGQVICAGPNTYGDPA